MDYLLIYFCLKRYLQSKNISYSGGPTQKNLNYYFFPLKSLNIYIHKDNIDVKTRLM